MDLDVFAGLPAYRTTIGGRTFQFGELSLSALAALQAWVRAHVPHPLEAVKPHLAGLDPADRAALLEQARRDGLRWPPKVGTGEGAAALLGDEEGQAETLYHALLTHQPETTREQARRLYRLLVHEGLKWDADEARAAAIEGRAPREFPKLRDVLAVAFGMPVDAAAEEEEAAPKGEAAAATAAGRPGSTS